MKLTKNVKLCKIPVKYQGVYFFPLYLTYIVTKTACIFYESTRRRGKVLIFYNIKPEIEFVLTIRA